MTLYETLAQEIITDITHQKLPTGSRLPALRTLAKQHSISLTTATKTYDYLMQSGWIYARPQAGYFVAGRYNEASFTSLPREQVERRDPKLYAPSFGYTPHVSGFAPLGTSMLSPELLPDIALQRTIKRVTRRASHTLFSYPEQQGLLSLRQALAAHFRKAHFPFSEQEVVITNSCLESVRVCIETVSKEQDAIAVCSPCFSGLLDLLTTLSREIIEIPMSQDGIDLEVLEACFAKRQVKAALLSTSHINPLGITLSTEQKQAIARLAAKYQTPVIEDDIYFELSHQKLTTLPAKYWDKAGYILWCSSISKTLAPGLRLGWCLPGRYFDDFLTRHSQTSLGVNSLTQASIGEFILTGDYDGHIHKIQPLLHNQVHQYRQFLLEHLPASTQISHPTGGIVLWLRIPGLDAPKLFIKARESGIDVRSGDCFSTHSIYNDCLRINCGWPLQEDSKPSQAQQQLKHLSALIMEQLKQDQSPN